MRAEVRVRDLQRDHDRIAAAPFELAGQPGRRLHLRNRIAQDEIDPGRAAVTLQHEVSSSAKRLTHDGR